jgi:hypothetical protein
VEPGWLPVGEARDRLQFREGGRRIALAWGMTPDGPDGFRFHLRHLAILAIFFSVLLGIFTPLARRLGAYGLLNPPLLLVLASPWLLGVLVLLLERRSPVKFWAAPLLLSLMAPALAVGHDWLVLDSWHRLQIAPNLFVTLGLNIGLIGSFTLFVTKMFPSRCPDCRGLTMIPLRGFWGPSLRTPTTRWCASCGAMYWKTSQGDWKREQRRTWLDLARNGSPHREQARRERFDKDARAFSPLLTHGRVTLTGAPVVDTITTDRAAGSGQPPSETRAS